MFRLTLIIFVFIIFPGCNSMLDNMAEENNKNTFVYRGTIVAITNAKAEIYRFPPESSSSQELKLALIQSSPLVGILASLLIRDANKEDIVESYIVSLTDGSNLTIPRDNRPYTIGDCIEFITFNEIGTDFSKHGRLELIKLDCENI